MVFYSVFVGFDGGGIDFRKNVFMTIRQPHRISNFRTMRKNHAPRVGANMPYHPLVVSAFDSQYVRDACIKYGYSSLYNSDRGNPAKILW